jgi:hypothetical protein
MVAIIVVAPLIALGMPGKIGALAHALVAEVKSVGTES